MKSLFLAALLVAFLAAAYGYEQNITVVGQIICDKKTIRNARVELREHDTLDPDDSLNVIHTDKDGKFRIFGKEDEITSIRPYIRINHKCDVTEANCYRVTDFDIPVDKVGGVYEMNYINLDIRGHVDKTKCD
uniref:Transthyretin-like family protein n=1 Tax=Steinernema glaseri TaxID=37863 RepID=A0A1I7Y410_9BILA